MTIIKNQLKLGNATVISDDILKAGKVVPGTVISPKYIVIHNTELWDIPAIDYHESLKTQNTIGERIASWHFTVDDKEIIQSVDTNWMTWNTSHMSGHLETVAIEICKFTDDWRQKLAEDNTIALIHYLAKLHKLNIKSCLRKHQDYTGKFCPQIILSRSNGWDEFLNKVYTYK